MSAIVSMFVTAFLSVMGKLAGQKFFEAVLTKVIIYGLEKLAPMTSNTLDDNIVAEIKRKLLTEN